MADEVKSYEKSDREVHFDRQTGKMLGWFIEHRPSRVTRLFGTIIGRAETELDVPREMTTRSLRSSIRMRVKEVKVSDTERFVICHNPDGAERDAHIRAQLIAQLEELIAGSDKLPVMKRSELRGRISTKPGLHRYLRVTPGGLLRVDKAKIKLEANLDGKYLLRCSDPHLSAADIALGYKQLLEVERGWRDMVMYSS